MHGFRVTIIIFLSEMCPFLLHYVLHLFICICKRSSLPLCPESMEEFYNCENENRKLLNINKLKPISRDLHRNIPKSLMSARQSMQDKVLEHRERASKNNKRI